MEQNTGTAKNGNIN